MLQSQYSIHFRQTQTQVNQSLSGYGPGIPALASRNLITQHDMGTVIYRYNIVSKQDLSVHG